MDAEGLIVRLLQGMQRDLREHREHVDAQRVRHEAEHAELVRRLRVAETQAGHAPLWVRGVLLALALGWLALAAVVGGVVWR